jgi:hypothetical protein
MIPKNNKKFSFMRKIRYSVMVQGKANGAIATVLWRHDLPTQTYTKTGYFIDDVPAGHYNYLLAARLKAGTSLIISVDDITDLSNVVELIPDQVYATAVVTDNCGYPVGQ